MVKIPNQLFRLSSSRGGVTGHRRREYPDSSFVGDAHRMKWHVLSACAGVASWSSHDKRSTAAAWCLTWVRMRLEWLRVLLWLFEKWEGKENRRERESSDISFSFPRCEKLRESDEERPPFFSPFFFPFFDYSFFSPSSRAGSLEGRD